MTESKTRSFLQVKTDKTVLIKPNLADVFSFVMQYIKNIVKETDCVNKSFNWKHYLASNVCQDLKIGYKDRSSLFSLLIRFSLVN